MRLHAGQGVRPVWGKYNNIPANAQRPMEKTAQELFEEGRAAYDSGDAAGALKSWEAALSLDPSFVEAWFSKGIAQGRLGRWESALESLERALELDDLHAGSWTFKGVVLDKLGREEEALRAFDASLK